MKFKASILFFFCFALSIYAQETEKVDIIVEGESVRIMNEGVNANCCSKYMSEISISEGQIRITEVDTSTTKCKCMCIFDLETDINYLVAGHYVIDVYRRELKQFGYPEDREYLVGSGSIDIISTTMPPVTQNFIQSDCKGTSDVQDQAYQTGSSAISPNPARGDLAYIKFSLSAPGNAVITIYNIFGQEVEKTSSLGLQAGENLAPVSIDKLTSGVYTAIISDDSGAFSSVKFSVAE